MPDTTLLIGGAVAIVVLLVILLAARSRKKPKEEQPAAFVPPSPFEKPPVSGPVSTPPKEAAPVSTPDPFSSPGPVSGPVSTPHGAPPVSGPISAPMTPAPEAQRVSAEVPAAAAPVSEPEPIVQSGQTAPPPAAPEPAPAPAPAAMAPIEEPDLATQAMESPPVSLESDALDSVRAAPPPPPKPAPAPPKPAPIAPPKPISERTPAAKPISERIPAAPVTKPAAQPMSKQTAPATPQAKAPSRPDVPKDAELDFSALRDKKSEPKMPAAGAAGAIAAKYVAAPNPETAELEKSDPRHAAARRLARLSVSEIKLYHEADVTEGRAKKDLWKRLQADITLATQTYDKRVDQDVRDRFDYLYDEILRQLAEGNAELLGPEAPKPKPKTTAAAGATGILATPLPVSESAKVTAPAVTKRHVEPTNPETADLERSDSRHAAARRLARLSVSEIKLYHEAEVTEGRAKKDLWTRLQADIALATQTYDKRVDADVRDRFDYLYDEILKQLAEGDVEKLGPNAPKPRTAGGPVTAAAPVVAPAAKEEPKPESKREPEPAPAAKAEEAKVEEPKVEEPKPAESKPTEVKPTMPGVRYAPPSNPETAELEKSDPRHAAARRLARLSVSEIKLYHEDEVKLGREKKDLYTRLGADIALAKQTFEKRVDQEVRDRYDYLYDEIVRQLAEGNEELLGPDAPPKPKKTVTAPEPPPEPKPEPKPEPVVEAAPEPAPAPAPTPAAPAVDPSKTTQPSAVAKYLAPSNPATAELEKSDPRHAAARRLARLSVSEIKLYHEAEVTEGRAKKDLWTRLQGDIALAKQTFDKRVDQEVRDRFDYLYDEILRQLAEGDHEKLGPEAPKPKSA